MSHSLYRGNNVLALKQQYERILFAFLFFSNKGTISLQTVHSKQANRALKRKELRKKKKRE